jgi:hypothetical protein
MKALLVTVGIVLGALALSIGILIFILFNADMCGNTEYLSKTSPSGEHKVVMFERNCGATTDFSTQISILDGDATLENEAGNVFIIPGHPDNVAPELFWSNSSTLKIMHKLGSREHLAEKNYDKGKVKILYE